MTIFTGNLCSLMVDKQWLFLLSTFVSFTNQKTLHENIECYNAHEKPIHNYVTTAYH